METYLLSSTLFVFFARLKKSLKVQVCFRSHVVIRYDLCMKIRSEVKGFHLIHLRDLIVVVLARDSLTPFPIWCGRNTKHEPQMTNDIHKTTKFGLWESLSKSKQMYWLTVRQYERILALILLVSSVPEYIWMVNLCVDHCRQRHTS